MTRRQFCATLAATSTLPYAHSAPNPPEPAVQTVLGPIAASRFGFTLPHEHVMCDFIGAGQTGRLRWEVAKVVQTMRPFLRSLKDRGVAGFVDCTPAYIGRDPRVLKILAEETGLHILTNTGYYGGAGDKFVPDHAYRESVDQLAERWVTEWQDGIEETGVKPGFIKIGVDEVEKATGPLSSIDAKLVRASAKASLRTKLTVTCHTGGGPAGLEAARLFVAEGGEPARFIVAHSDGHGPSFHQRIAQLGAWISLDGVSRRPLDEHVQLVRGLLQPYSAQLLISQDNGWYWVEKGDGGEVRDFNYLADVFLPACRQSGVDEKTIRQLTVVNPARAFAS